MPSGSWTPWSLDQGLDFPECGLVAILDADKEGYLRSETSLVQTIGRAARNVEGRVILYADTMTKSLAAAMGETERRRNKQIAWNEAHGITPQSIRRQINDIIKSVAERDYVTVDLGEHAPATLTGLDLQAHIGNLEKQMRDAAANLEFEEAARIRDEIRRLEDGELGLPEGARPRAATGSANFAPQKRGIREEKRQRAEASRRGGARRRTGP